MEDSFLDRINGIYGMKTDDLKGIDQEKALPPYLSRSPELFSLG